MNRKLTQQEIESSLHQYPPILTPEEAARLLQLKLSTLYRHLSEGKYNGAVTACAAKQVPNSVCDK